MSVISAMRYEDQIVVVTPYFKHSDFRDYLPSMTLDDIRHYMYSLFKAVRHVHSNSIIHRDLKPSNFLYSVKKKRGLLVDFGLAQIYTPLTLEETPENAALLHRSATTAPPFPSPSAVPSNAAGTLNPKSNTNKNLKIIAVPNSSKRACPGYMVNDTR